MAQLTSQKVLLPASVSAVGTGGAVYLAQTMLDGGVNQRGPLMGFTPALSAALVAGGLTAYYESTE